MKNSEKIMIALAAGTAIGALLGVFFAPDKGKITRKKLKENGKKFKGGLDELKQKVQLRKNGFKKDYVPEDVEMEELVH